MLGNVFKSKYKAVFGQACSSASCAYGGLTMTFLRSMKSLMRDASNFLDPFRPLDPVSPASSKINQRKLRYFPMLIRNSFLSKSTTGSTKSHPPASPPKRRTLDRPHIVFPFSPLPCKAIATAGSIGLVPANAKQLYDKSTQWIVLAGIPFLFQKQEEMNKSCRFSRSGSNLSLMDAGMRM